MKKIFFLVLILYSTFLISAVSLDLSWISPTGNMNIEQNNLFNIIANISCSGGNCGNVNVTLDPSSTIYNFTTCSASGMAGPTLANCNTNYTGTTLAGLVGVVSGIQNFTVPVSGTYIIEAAGAAGGNGLSGVGGNG